MRWVKVKELVAQALADLLDADAFLLESNAHERTIAARLAYYLADRFPDHAVDVEYNRHGLRPKSVAVPAVCAGGGDRLVLPDIIVHRRNTDEDNLLVIELKKESNPEPRDCDYAKLAALQQQFNYSYGIFIELPVGPGAALRQARVQRVTRSGRITMQ